MEAIISYLCKVTTFQKEVTYSEWCVAINTLWPCSLPCSKYEWVTLVWSKRSRAKTFFFSNVDIRQYKWLTIAICVGCKFSSLTVLRTRFATFSWEGSCALYNSRILLGVKSVKNVWPSSVMPPNMYRKNPLDLSNNSNGAALVRIFWYLQVWPAHWFGEQNWASTRETLSSVVCEQQRRRPACATAQTDQRLC